MDGRIVGGVEYRLPKPGKATPAVLRAVDLYRRAWTSPDERRRAALYRRLDATLPRLSPPETAAYYQRIYQVRLASPPHRAITLDPPRREAPEC